MRIKTNNSSTKKNIFIALVFIAVNVFAQQDSEQGYIINEKGGTLHGKINDGVNEKYSISSQKIKFIGADGKEQKFKAKKIKEYCKKGFPIYRTITTNRGNKKFAEILENGAVLLFKYNKVTMEGDAAYNAGTSNVQYIDRAPVIYVEYYVQKKGNEKTLIMVPMSTFTSSMSRFFSDDPDIKKRIEEKSLLLENLQDIVKEYNKKRAL